MITVQEEQTDCFTLGGIGLESNFSSIRSFHCEWVIVLKPKGKPITVRHQVRFCDVLEILKEMLIDTGVIEEIHECQIVQAMGKMKPKAA